MLTKKSISFIVFPILIIIISRMLSNHIIQELKESTFKSEYIESTINERKFQIERDNEYWPKVVDEIFLKGVDEKSPVTKHFRDKYKNNNVLENFFVDKTTDQYEWIYKKNDGTYENNYYTYGINNGIGEKSYEFQVKYIITPDYLLDDIELYGKRVTKDENGKRIEYPDSYYFDATIGFTNMAFLVEPEITAPYTIKVNNNFKSKFPDYPQKGILPNEQYLYTDISYETENNIFVAIYTFYNLQYTTNYRINVICDTDGYVDDAIIELVSRIPTEDPKYVQSVYEDNLY